MYNNQKAIFVGTFDPFTLAHLDVLKRAKKLFNEIIVLVSNNVTKQYWFSHEERQHMIQEIVNGEKLTGVTVEVLKEKTAAQYLTDNNLNFFIRGVRNIKDWENETFLYRNNTLLNKSCETVVFITNADLSFISSSLCKEIILNGGDISHFVTKNVAEQLKGRVNAIKK